jgi:hypothetical protein
MQFNGVKALINISREVGNRLGHVPDIRIGGQRRGHAGFRIGSLILFLAAILWATLVLRRVRLYGMATCLKQRWTARQTGPEGMQVPAPARAQEPPPWRPEPDGVLS